MPSFECRIFETRHSKLDTPMTYPEAEAFLLNLPRFAIKGAAAYEPGLERIAAVLEAMGNPHKAYPVVHIAGTNGKGSTASCLSAIAVVAGRKTGLHTSPHLLHLAERMRVDGVPAPETWIAQAVTMYADVFRDVQVSFFEAMVALSFHYFAAQRVDLAIVEVGLGGRLDATNIVSPELAIITSIGLDHVDILGNSIRDIAREKAGIIKSGVPVITGAQQPDALDVIGQIADIKEVQSLTVLDQAAVWTVIGKNLDGFQLKVRTSQRVYDALDVALTGEYQVRNALLALLAAEILFDKEKTLPGIVAAGLANVKAHSGLSGRMEVVKKEPLVVLDVGHNSEGLYEALKSMTNALTVRRGQLFVMFGTMRDKDIKVMAGHLSAFDARVFVPPLYPDGTIGRAFQAQLSEFKQARSNKEIQKSTRDNRAMPSEELVQFLREQRVDVQHVSSLEEGLLRFEEEATSRDGLLVVGSHVLVSQYLKMDR